MRGIQRFKDKDRGLPPGTPVSTAEHPFQSFQWGDYTAQTGRTYRYRIVPACGSVKRIELDEAASVSVTIGTEIEYLLGPRPPRLWGVSRCLFQSRRDRVAGLCAALRQPGAGP